MATFKGFNRSEYWSLKEIDDFDGAPIRLNNWMSKRRFDTILSNLHYTDKERPTFQDRFHNVRQLIQAWNKNMTEKFLPSWVSCLDESMSAWISRWTCPGWVFCPRKPHPFGNEYHSICCGDSGIMYQIELVEGKDAPTQHTQPHSDKGKTAGLLLRLCAGIAGRGMVVILDSGFCVLQGLVELKKIGVFASAVIKKRRYWPKHVPGEQIDDRMKEKEIGDVDALKGTLDGVPYNIMCMKDVDYTMKLMSTYGSTLPTEAASNRFRSYEDANGNKATKEFKYTECFDNHFRYRHAVDDHNNLRHSDISLEETWMTHRWENRVFAFILAITEVNMYLAYKYFVWKTTTTILFLRFRRKLAKALIYNEYISLDEEEDVTPRKSKRQRRQQDHVKQTAPNHARYFDGKNG